MRRPWPSYRLLPQAERANRALTELRWNPDRGQSAARILSWHRWFVPHAGSARQLSSVHSERAGQAESAARFRGKRQWLGRYRAAKDRYFRRTAMLARARGWWEQPFAFR